MVYHFRVILIVDEIFLFLMKDKKLKQVFTCIKEVSSVYSDFEVLRTWQETKHKEGAGVSHLSLTTR